MGLGNPALGRTDLHVFNDQRRRLIRIVVAHVDHAKRPVRQPDHVVARLPVRNGGAACRRVGGCAVLELEPMGVYRQAVRLFEPEPSRDGGMRFDGNYHHSGRP